MDYQKHNGTLQKILRQFRPYYIENVRSAQQKNPGFLFLDRLDTFTE